MIEDQISLCKPSKGESSRKKAGILSQTFFWWIFKLIRLGNSQELEVWDLDPCESDYTVAELQSKFSKSWTKELRKSKPSLLKALLSSIGFPFFLGTFAYCFVQFILRILVTLVFGYLLRYMSGEYSRAFGYGMTAAYIAITFTASIILNHAIGGMRFVAMKARVALTGAIYDVALQLGQDEMAQTGIGQLTSLLSTDLSRFDYGLEAIPYLLIVPIQLIIVFAILWQYLGISALVGPFIVMILVGYQVFITKLYRRYRRKAVIETGSRIRLLSELLNSMTLVKLFAWENLYFNAINSERLKEVGFNKKKGLFQAANLSTVELTSNITNLATLLTFILLGNQLTPEAVFVTMSMYGVVSYNVRLQLGWATVSFSDISIAISRIQAFLLLGKTEKDGPTKDQSPTVVKTQDIGLNVQNLSTRWPNMSSSVFQNVNFTAKAHDLVGIVGPVGSGKSSILLALLGELPTEVGSVQVNGRIAYVSQDPWIFPASIRDNIIFGRDYEPNWYSQVLEACALQYDIHKFEHGDQTLIADKGSNLSGGQKARINLARAVYSKADIYLLDDPLSSVDVKVARHLMEKCIRGVLADKSVVLVTHQANIRGYTQNIIRLGNGAFTKEEEASDELEQLNIDDLFAEADIPVEAVDRGVPKAENGYGTFEQQNVLAETRTKGKIKFSVLLKYFSAGNSTWSLLCTLLLFIIFQAFVSGSDIFLQVWTDAERNGTKRGSSSSSLRFDYLGIYAVLVLFALIFSFSRSIKLTLDAMYSSLALHTKLLQAILRAPIRFLETNTSGRVLNRFSNDLGVMDDFIPMRVFWTSTTLFSTVGSSVVVSIISPVMILPTLIFYAIMAVIMRYYLMPSSNVMRLEGISRSPILSQIASALIGLPTIRAFKKENYCRNNFQAAQDTHTRAFSAYLYMGLWIRILAEMLGDLYISIVMISFVLSDTSPSVFGLIMNSLLRILLDFPTVVFTFAGLANQLISIERIMEYTEIRPEAPLRIPSSKPPPHWPASGEIRTNHLSVSYDQGPRVLTDISLLVKSNEKIGIIGRTGAGKSSLVSALFRLVEKESGSIHIDGIDICKLGLHDLREKISIIPQMPFLFSGSIRQNLDPFGRFQDAELWQAVEQVQLKERLTEDALGLESMIVDGGNNLSQGQRQLVQLARTILGRNRILVLDEATSSIDPETDALIQRVLRERYKDSTVLTIAHRLDTVMDSHRILVLDAGTVVEFGEPLSLLANHESYLYQLVQRTPPNIRNRLYNIARGSKQD